MAPPIIGSCGTQYTMPVDGQMPAFKNQLTENEILGVIAYFQSYWTDDIYGRWLQIEKSSRE